MVFSSAVFVFLFLPLTYVLCLLIPGILAKNIFLTVMSLIFYAFGEPVYVLLMIASMLGNYWVGRLLGPHGLRCRKTVIICAVAANLMLLGVFKYAAFGTEILNGLTGWSIPLPQIALPIGISFYTFQSISYIVDVYRQPEISQKDFIHVALYISFFPQLIAGPILQYSDVDAQISNRRMTVDGTFYGIGRFILGLSKKMLISNVAGSIADSLEASAPFAHADDCRDRICSISGGNPPAGHDYDWRYVWRAAAYIDVIGALRTATFPLSLCDSFARYVRFGTA